MKTSIDIVLAYFNGSRFLADQLRSIEENLRPGVFSVRLIIIDDASSKGESALLNKMRKDLPNVEVHRNAQNLGVIKSFERGLSLTTAPYIMLCDQDDYWLPHKIEQSLAKIQEVEIRGMPALVFSDVRIVDETLQTLHPSMFQRYSYKPEETIDSILFRNIVTGCTVLFNRELLNLAYPFPEEITMHDHWLAICAAYLGVLEAIEKPSMLYRQHGSNQVGAPEENMLYKAMNLPAYYPRYLKNLRRKIQQIRSLAKILRSNGKATDAERIIQIAAQLESGSLKDCISLIRQKVIHRSAFPLLARALLPSGKRI